jgi:CubicO group peptidase (beta-lactamase class C family)
MKLTLKVLMPFFLFVIVSCKNTIDKKFTNISKLERVYVDSLISKYQVPIVGVGIIEEGEIKSINVYGSYDDGIEAKKNTVFNIASITKVIFTMTVLKLVEEGRWDLDKPLYTFWVDPRVKDNPWHKLLTSRTILTHRSGLPNWGNANELEFLFKPGTDYNYSGEGFEYLKKALENAFGLSMETLSKKTLFEPLNMNDTKYTWKEETFASRFATWHDGIGALYQEDWKNTEAHASDDLLTTVTDLSIFLTHVINGAGLSEPLYQDMITSHTKVNDSVSYGLGWNIVHNLPNNEYALYHDGGDYGVRTAVFVLPKSKRGLVILTNGDKGDYLYQKIASKVFDVGHDIFKNLEIIPPDIEFEKIIKIPENILLKYEGRYSEKGEGMDVLITRVGNTLKLKEDSGSRQRVYLHPIALNRFFVEGESFEAEFVKNKNNLIIEMNLYERNEKIASYLKIN